MSALAESRVHADSSGEDPPGDSHAARGIRVQAIQRARGDVEHGAFVRGATVPGAAQNLRDPVADWLEEIAISPAIDEAMSQGTAGAELTRKYRRAMILILCALNSVPTAQAQQVATQYLDAVLAATLGTMLEDVQRVAAPRRLERDAHALLAADARAVAVLDAVLGG